MSIYKNMSQYEIQAAKTMQYNIFVSVFGLRFNIKTIADSEKKATKNVMFRLGEYLFYGQSPAMRLVQLNANNPVVHFVKPENWNDSTIKTI